MSAFRTVFLAIVWVCVGQSAWAESPNCVDDEGSFVGQATELQDIAELDDGTLYAVEGDKAHVFQRSSDGLFYTIAGGARGHADGDLSEARFMGPYGLASGGDRLYIVDTRGQRLRVLLDDQIHTVAGDGRRGFKDGTGATARFAHPVDAVVMPSGAILVADKLNHAIRRVIVGSDPTSSVVQTVAGTGLPGSVDGPSDVASFRWPVGLAVGPDDSVYVADQGNHAIRRIWPDGVVTTWAGGTYGYQSGSRSAARLGYLGRIAADSMGWLFLTDRVLPGVLSVDPDGLVTPLTGTGIGSGTGNAEGSHYRFPEGITVTGAGEVLVADIGNGSVKTLGTCGGAPPQASACVGPVCDFTLGQPYGCTDASATNHDVLAELDDGTCEYACAEACQNGGTCNVSGHCVCAGTGHHGAACEEPDIASCPSGAGPAFEVCDGIDNDCNGVIDDGLGVVSCGIGGCAQTVEACSNGIELNCDPTELKSDEICDGVDNDCDGQTDEGQGAAYCGFGVCKRLVSGCIAGVPTDCDPFDGASDETCNTQDDDCDGKVDEGFGEVLCGTGVCRHVQRNCIAGVSYTCDPMQGAYGEVCDGLDNDCDGETDEGTGELSCGVGECAKTIDACKGGVPQSCNAQAGASPEVCDGLDNNCNGLVDDGLGTVSCGKGACVHSVQSCIGGVTQVCDPMEGAIAEICGDTLDNDCDGVVDDGCPADNDGDGYTEDVDCNDVNASIHPGVDEVCGDSVDNNCNAQIDEDCVEDDDDDGYGAEDDCNDSDKDIHPGADEVCEDGVDNNCDGQIDEGCVPVGLCEGDYFVGSQAALDEISHCVTIEGLLHVEGSSVTSLAPLEGLREVKGKLVLKHLQATSLAQLSDLETVGGDLDLIYNTSLQTLGHLSKLTSVGGRVYLWSLHKVTNLSGLDQLTNVPGHLIIHDLPKLTNIDALSNVETVGGQLKLEDNELLTDLAGLSAVVTVGGQVAIDNNDSLTSLSGLDGLIDIGFDIAVVHNSALCQNDVEDFLDNLCSVTPCQVATNAFNKSADCISCGGYKCDNNCGGCSAGSVCQDEICVCDTTSFFRYYSSQDAPYEVTLPSCANKVKIDVYGGMGGGSLYFSTQLPGGKGARIHCELTGYGGKTLKVRAGKMGEHGGTKAGGGGGASAVWIEEGGTKTPLVVAGGGGGASWWPTGAGQHATILPWGTNGGSTKGTNGGGGGSGKIEGDLYGGGGGGWSVPGSNAMQHNCQSTPPSQCVASEGGDLHSGQPADYVSPGPSTGGNGGDGRVAGGGQGGHSAGGGGGGYSGGGGGLWNWGSTVGGGGGGSWCAPSEHGGAIIQGSTQASEGNGVVKIVVDPVN